MFVTGFFKSGTLTLGDKVLKNKSDGGSDIFFAKYDPAGKLLWAKSAGGTGDEEPLAISCDKSGNVIIRGFFESDNIAFDGTTLKNNNKGDLSMFLVKYDGTGKLLWAKSAEVFPTAHYMDATGNIYVTGELFKNIKTSFDHHAFTPVEDGTFIVKYSPEGKVQWLKRGAGSEPFSIGVDVAGNVFVSGMITSKVHQMEGGQMFQNTGVDRSSDIFFMKLNADGKIIWEKTISGQGDEEPRAQYVNPNGNLYVVIRYTSMNLKLGQQTITNGGGDDLLLIKYDPNGEILWAKSSGGSGHDNPIFLVTDANENIYIAGHYYSDKISFDELTLNNVGLNDIFIVKFAPDGKVLWAKTSGGGHHDYPNGLLVDELGNIYLIGEFNSSPNKDKVTSDFFMEKYDTNGNPVWKSAEHKTEAFDFAFGECIDKVGNLYVVGYFGDNLKFGKNNYKSNGSKDLFILKYNVKK